MTEARNIKLIPIPYKKLSGLNFNITRERTLSHLITLHFYLKTSDLKEQLITVTKSFSNKKMQQYEREQGFT